ncbi:hypothetical protein E2C01_059115 [Portunus trituberculatus]|uniref:Uncharacterized protein n=1 Tax=Portunus trituberculatus TaxID=210409 RepID=A0A5B7H1N6_PORTR|nr:hypothetical protein [Portunus trituberculatus]
MEFSIHQRDDRLCPTRHEVLRGVFEKCIKTTTNHNGVWYDSDRAGEFKPKFLSLLTFENSESSLAKSSGGRLRAAPSLACKRQTDRQTDRQLERLLGKWVDDKTSGQTYEETWSEVDEWILVDFT